MRMGKAATPAMRFHPTLWVALLHLLLAGIGFMWVMVGVTLRHVAWAVVAVAVANIAYEFLLPLLNTRDPVDAAYGIAGTLCALAWLWIIVRFGLRPAQPASGGRMTIRFKAKLFRPAEPKNASWTFLVLPKAASAKLPTRAMTTVDGTLAGAPFKGTLEPDGDGSHWLKVPKSLREAAGAKAGETVALEIAPSDTQLEPSVPADLRKALAANPAAKSTWTATTTVARRDWVAWMTSGKKAETRDKRLAGAIDMLENGKKRVCCFDRSGIAGGNFSAPEAAE